MSGARMKIVGARDLVEVDVTTGTNSVTIGDNELNASELALDVPITGTVYGTLLNYRGEIEKLGNTVHETPYNAPPIAPVLYIKPANTFNRNGAAIPMPAGISKLKMGAALGVVIGEKAVAIDEEFAMSYVAGYTIVNDVSVPHDSVYRPAVQHQARDGFCPIGPWIINRHEVRNPDDLVIRVFINEELRQENTTSNLIRSVSRLLADVTEFMTLRPGDVLLVGVPEEAPQAEIGDRIRIEIEDIGSLENVISDEKQLKWWETL